MGYTSGCRITTQTTTAAARDSICELLKRIDKMQREAVTNEIQSRCDTCILPITHNTVPVAFWTACGRFEAVDPATGNPAGLFRIEEVKGCDTVLLRILRVKCDQIICTDCTCELRIQCICAMQCFDAIRCDNICFKAH